MTNDTPWIRDKLQYYIPDEVAIEEIWVFMGWRKFEIIYHTRNRKVGINSSKGGESRTQSSAVV
ncbi:hypothetical protein U9R62_04900 [Cylindrospermopsis raciborskii DSH]|uniref:hypothetical protein n=1 Tax=Cylindrospermopsis raciborskii TaxID=77022 RepID=UPI002ED92F4C